MKKFVLIGIFLIFIVMMSGCFEQTEVKEKEKKVTIPETEPKEEDKFVGVWEYYIHLGTPECFLISGVSAGSTGTITFIANGKFSSIFTKGYNIWRLEGHALVLDSVGRFSYSFSGNDEFELMDMNGKTQVFHRL